MSDTKHTEVIEIKTDLGISDKLDQYFLAAKEVLEQYGGDVAELGLNVLRIDALVHVLPGVILLLLLYPVMQLHRRLIAFEKENSSDLFFNVFFGAIFWVAYMVILGCGLFNVWAWIGIFYPELYAVHKFILT